MEKTEGNEETTDHRVEETHEETRERLERLEEQEEEANLEELAQARSLADAEEMINYASIKRKLPLPTLGYFVEYLPLTIMERAKILEITDPNREIQRDKRNRMKVFLLMSRADERWTWDKVDGLAATIIDIILYEHENAEDGRFLLPVLRRRSSGLRRALKPRNTS